MLYKKYFSPFVLFFLFNNLSAQVPVMQEPHHKPVLVNDYIRLLDVHINAGDTTLYHIHAAPSVIVILSNSVIGMQKMGEAPSAANNVTAGATSFVHYETNPITHRVFNAGDNVFHVMDIELVKNNPSPDSCAALQQSNIATTINEKLVRTYKFNLNSKASLSLAKSSCAYLLVCITGEVNSSNKKIQEGEYLFFNPNTRVELNNPGNNNASCVILELK